MMVFGGGAAFVAAFFFAGVHPDPAGVVDGRCAPIRSAVLRIKPPAASRPCGPCPRPFAPAQPVLRAPLASIKAVRDVCR